MTESFEGGTMYKERPPAAAFASRLRTLLLPYGLFIFLPIAIVLYVLNANVIITALITTLALVPTTSMLSRSTHELSLRAGSAVGSLFNATFGNAIELFIAVFALRAGLVEMVQASLSGSIIINILLLIGLSMLFGGIKHREQTFNKDSAGVASTMLLIAVAGLSLPTLYSLVTGRPAVVMSQAVSIALATVYLLSLFFTLFTHRHLFVAKREATEQGPRWTTKFSIAVLIVAMGLAALESNILVGLVDQLTSTLTLSQAFLGLVFIAIITNIPEHLAAITFGMRGNITLSLEIGMNSAIQIALFVAPVLVFISPLVTGNPLSLAFTPFELVGLVLAVMIINYISSDGVCNWLEGVQLVSVYAIIAIAFYFI